MVCAEPTEELKMQLFGEVQGAPGAQLLGITAIILIATLVAYALWRRASNHLRLNWGTLAIFLRDNSQIEQTELPDAQSQWGIGTAVQLKDELGYVVYKRSMRPNDHIEILDVLRFGEPELFITFVSERPISFSRATGRATQNPMLNAQQSMILLELLRRVRRLADKK